MQSCSTSFCVNPKYGVSSLDSNIVYSTKLLSADSSSIFLIGNIPVMYAKARNFLDSSLLNKECRNCNLYLCGSFVIEFTSLILIYFSDNFNDILLVSVDLLVVLSIGSFLLAIYKHFKLNELLNALQF